MDEEARLLCTKPGCERARWRSGLWCRKCRRAAVGRRQKQAAKDIWDRVGYLKVDRNVMGRAANAAYYEEFGDE